MPRIADTPPPSDAADDWTWRRAVADGHLHRDAKDCPHLPPREACRVCCPHDDLPDVRVDQLAPDDEVDDWSPLLAVVCAVVGFMVIAAVGYGAIYALAAIAGVR